jgi:hypothetical protein
VRFLAIQPLLPDDLSANFKATAQKQRANGSVANQKLRFSAKIFLIKPIPVLAHNTSHFRF